MRLNAAAAGTGVLVVSAAIWALWGRNEGAWSGDTFYPGAMAFCLLAVVLLAAVPFRARLGLSRPTLIALVALFALAAWNALSALWSPSPDVAVEGGQRIAVYAIVFGIGLWLCAQLGSEMRLGLWQFVFAAAFVGALTAAEMILADAATAERLLAEDGTLEQPLGYRNANAAFFFIALFPAIGVAVDRGLDWRARGLALATATLSIDLALLSQSRGSAYALAAALIVFVLASPRRARALVWLALAALPAAAVLPVLTDIFREVNDGGAAAAVGELQLAGLLAIAAAAVSFALAGLAARIEERPGGLGIPTPSNRAVALGLAGTVAAIGIAFVVAIGDPIEWFGERASEFEGGGTPDLSDEASRFTFNVASGRGDIWSVAIDAGLDEPLHGDGGGGFEYRYSREATVDQYVRDAHNVMLSVFAELGLPGLALLSAAFGGIILSLRQSWRLGVRAAALVAVALGSATYWLVHASLDWFWPYAGVTAPVFALVALACGPGILWPEARMTRRGRRLRIALAAGAGILVMTMVPLFLSDVHLDRAKEEPVDDPAAIERAYDELESAHDLNPLSVDPLLIEGDVARRVGDRRRAVAAYEAAIEQRPEAWQADYALARIYDRRDPELALEHIEAAIAINPVYQRMQVLRDELLRRLEPSQTEN